MKSMRLPILLASLLLAAASALPAGAQTVTVPKSDQSKVSPLTPTRNEYMRRAQTQYNDWAQKVGDLQLRIMQKRVSMSAEAKANIDRAWNELKLDWSRLGGAKDADWVSARDAWETGAANMQSVWDKFAD